MAPVQALVDQPHQLQPPGADRNRYAISPTLVAVFAAIRLADSRAGDQLKHQDHYANDSECLKLQIDEAAFKAPKKFTCLLCGPMCYIR